MKKLLILLVFLLTFSSTIFAESHLGEPNGFVTYTWGTDIKVIQKEKKLQLVSDNGSEKLYFSKADSTSHFNILYAFSNHKLITGMFQFHNESDYYKVVEMLVEQYGEPHKENDDSLGWSFYTTSIIATEETESPSIFFLHNSATPDTLLPE